MEFCVARLRAKIEKDLTLKASAWADSVSSCAGAEYGGHEDIGSSSISYFNQF